MHQRNTANLILFYRGCSQVVESFTEEQKRLCGILA